MRHRPPGELGCKRRQRGPYRSLSGVEFSCRNRELPPGFSCWRCPGEESLENERHRDGGYPSGWDARRQWALKWQPWRTAGVHADLGRGGRRVLDRSDRGPEELKDKNEEESSIGDVMRTYL